MLDSRPTKSPNESYLLLLYSVTALVVVGLVVVCAAWPSETLDRWTATLGVGLTGVGLALSLHVLLRAATIQEALNDFRAQSRARRIQADVTRLLKDMADNTKILRERIGKPTNKPSNLKALGRCVECADRLEQNMVDLGGSETPTLRWRRAGNLFRRLRNEIARNQGVLESDTEKVEDELEEVIRWVTLELQASRNEGLEHLS